MHHAFVIEAEEDPGVATALAWTERELGLSAAGNPDVVVLRHGLLTVADARKISELASQAAFVGDTRAIVIVASRVYHEAQNALLKVFEEPAPGVHLFLVLPTLGSLLPTMRSRVQVLGERRASSERNAEITGIDPLASVFVKAPREKRVALVKKLTAGKDEEARRENRDQAIALLNGIEGEARRHLAKNETLLEEIATLRGYLYDRSAPVKQILEHLAIVTPKDLV